MVERMTSVNEYRFRVLSVADHAALLSLWQRCDGISLRQADSPEGMRRYLDRNPDLSFVVELKGEIVASLMAGHDGRRGYIQHLAVDQAHRRQGLAGQLVDYCLDALADAGIAKSHVHVLRSNQTGQAFWQRKGWHLREEVEMYSFINGADDNA